MRSSILLLLAFACFPGCNSKETPPAPTIVVAADPVAPQLAALSSKSADERQAAAVALGALGDGAKSAIPALTEALNDPIKTVRAAAEDALAQIDPEGPIARSLAMKNKLRQIALGMRGFNDQYKNLPTTCTIAMMNDGKTKVPGLSWRVQLLPYLNETALYHQFHIEEPWDSEHNKKLIAQMPAIFAPPAGSPADTKPGTTHFQVFYAANPFVLGGTVFPHPFMVVHQNAISMNLMNIPDGSSNTFLVAEATKPVIWTKPEDMAFGNGPLPALGHCVDGVFHVCLADGSARVCGRGTPSAELRRFIAPADGLLNNHEALELKASAPMAKKLGTVSGSVKWKGQPVASGWVIFHTEDGQEFASRIDPDGKFTIANVPYGLSKIAVQPGDPLEGWLDNPTVSPKKVSFNVPPQYREEVLTPLQIRIVKTEETLDLDLQ